MSRSVAAMGLRPEQQESAEFFHAARKIGDLAGAMPPRSGG
jgi:hypothetical protein